METRLLRRRLLSQDGCLNTAERAENAANKSGSARAAAFAVGALGGGDVKLLAGVGAWVGASVTFYAFCWSTVVGGAIAVAMVLWRRAWTKHRDNFMMILHEVATVGSPGELATRAAARKSSMLLLPYGIPIAIGTIAYFVWTGMLV